MNTFLALLLVCNTGLTYCEPLGKAFPTEELCWEDLEQTANKMDSNPNIRVMYASCEPLVVGDPA